MGCKGSEVRILSLRFFFSVGIYARYLAAQNNYESKMDTKISIYLAGSIKKGHEKADESFWTDQDMLFLKKSLGEFDVSFLNPAFRSDNLSDQRSVFGRDMTQVFCSDVVFVDARDRRGLGVGAEMMWAKSHKIPVVTLAPKDSHYNKSKTTLLDVAVEDWVHPFVESLSDAIVENQENRTLGLEMNYHIEEQQKKYFIGFELRTNNEECSSAMPAHKEQFFNENITAKIPNRIDGNILALYTDYEGDYTKPYSWILGCEVSSLDKIPKGLVGKVIPESKYAVFTTQGEFPQGLIAAWQSVWQSNLSRSYTSDFELYRADFHPQQNPEVKVYISIDDENLN